MMKSKTVFLVLGLGMLVTIAGMNGGCASTSTTVEYSVPNWMPDGRIICGKLVITTSQQLYGGGISDHHSYVAAFYPSGTGETNLFEGGGNEITCSPTGELIAYITSFYDANGNYVDDGIQISDYAGNKTNLVNTSKVNYLDWSPDATKLVYSDDNRDLYIINRDGTGKTKIATSAEAVAWRVGEKIAYVGNKLTLINPDGSGTQETVTGGRPQIKNNGDIVFQYLTEVRSINSMGTNETTLFSGYQPYTFKLSFDGQKIVGGAFGDPGIWVMNIDGTGYTKIR